MPLTSGARLGPYEILALLGAGGMGEVYRAHDTRLGRDVALKVLPDVFARNAERMARFEREAQVLASLNHPNIAALYGLEESEGVRALVMELVEGETLKGPLPQEEAVAVARQIADALEYAHEKGVVHRDLKPANIKITPEAKVKVLDFGLAKALDDDPAAPSAHNSPTLSLAATRSGVILGTAAYMSPEQAKGKPVDRRADIWAFGVLLWEMLVGRQMYSGETVAETLAWVMTRAPEFEGLPPETPSALRNLLRRCLEKDPRLRLRDIGEARPGWAWPAVAALGLVAAAGMAVVHFRETAPQTLPTRFEIQPPEKAHHDNAAVSPDGRRLAMVVHEGAKRHLVIRPLDSLTAQPCWKVASGAGSDELLLRSDAPKVPWDWSRDGRYLVFSSIDPKTKIDLWILPLSGERKPQVLLQTEFSESHGQISPDGGLLAYQSDETGRPEIYVRPFPAGAGGKWQVSSGGGVQPRWRGDGKELYYLTLDKTLMAVAVNAGAAFQSSTPRALFDFPVAGNPAGPSFRYSASADGQRFLGIALQEDEMPLTVALNWMAVAKR